jgi:hypothetical protein
VLLKVSEAEAAEVEVPLFLKFVVYLNLVFYLVLESHLGV